jgi:membrane protease YdiL (CAAX protease family)
MTPKSVPTNRFARAAALGEVLLAFVFVHVTFRAFKHFTALGRLEGEAHLNFSPGVTMIFFTVCVLLLYRRSFSAYGLTTMRWREGLKVGLFWGVVLVAGGALLRWLGVHHLPGSKPPNMVEGVVYGAASLAAVIVFAWLWRRQRVSAGRVRSVWLVLLLIGLLCVPLVVALYYHRPFVHTLLTVSWLVFGAGCGEEIFYRGYIQSRINEAFGRPFRFMGVQFGVGLLVSSLLFGFLHALNSVDYFQGRFTFAWGYGVATIFVGLLYGCLRENTGSIIAGTITHAVVDVLVQVPVLISGP